MSFKTGQFQVSFYVQYLLVNFIIYHRFLRYHFHTQPIFSIQTCTKYEFSSKTKTDETKEEINKKRTKDKKIQNESQFNAYFTSEFQKSLHFTSGVKDNKEEEETKKLRPPKKGRKSEKQRIKEADNKQLKLEYRLLKIGIFSLAALIMYYIYNMFESNVGKADNYYKLAIEYELEKDFEKANECYLKCLKFTNEEFPKYLFEYSKFLCLKMNDFQSAEEKILQAIKLHPTNASYRRFYTQMIEDYGGDSRSEDCSEQRKIAVEAHLYEGQYFLSEEKNWKAARMHFDYGINFCKNEKFNEQKCLAYEVAARALNKHGFVEVYFFDYFR